MADYELGESHQRLADSMAGVVLGRIAAATSTEVLSDRGSKLLQVVEEADGQRVVTRSFLPEAVRHVERHGLKFTEAWNAMHQVFSGRNMRVVPSYLFSAAGKYSYVAVSEHLEGAMPVHAAPTDVKKDIAYNMGQLLKAKSGYLPAPEMINDDMFRVVQRDGGEYETLMIDTDPHVLDERQWSNRDTLDAHYINKVADLFWNEWCNQDETREVFGALVRSIGEGISDNTGTAAMMAFSNVHMMSSGMDPRTLGMRY